MTEYIDTHTHLFVSDFDEDREAAVQRAVDAGVTRLCLPAINEETLNALLAMCDRYPGICFPMMGLHPTDVGEDYKEVLALMHEKLLADSRIIAVGEVGLDFYWDDSQKERQIEAFRIQIGWAIETGLPLAIHSRSAFNELCEVLDEYRSCGLKGVFHCFTGSEEEVQKLLSFNGFYLGIGGVLTYKKSTLPAVLGGVPLERIVLETDSPYLSPVPFRGKRNESAYIPHIAEALSKIYNCSIEEVAAITVNNSCNLFKRVVK